MIRAGTLAEAWARAPWAALPTLIGAQGALVLAPHPDDESLGFGGLIAAAAAAGLPIQVAVLTDGVGSHPGSARFPPPRLKALREAETRDALAALGVARDGVVFLGAPDTAAPRGGAAFDRLADQLTALMRGRGLQSLFTSWRHDPHGDHEAAAELAARVARKTGAPLWMAPIWGWVLDPDHAVEASAERAVRFAMASHLPEKRRAIAAHRSQTTAMITDAAQAFRLEPRFLALFDRPFEVFIRA